MSAAAASELAHAPAPATVSPTPATLATQVTQQTPPSQYWYAGQLETLLPASLDPLSYPGTLDASRFKLDPSVSYWLRFGKEQENALSGNETLTTLAGVRKYFSALVERISVRDAAVSDPMSALYWSYHAARLSFFMGQAATGLVAHYTADRLRGSSSSPPLPSSLPPAADATSAGTSQPRKTPLEMLLSSGQSELTARISEAVATWSADLANIRAGKYQLPWDMTTVTHVQFNPLYMVRKTLEFAQEATSTLTKRMAKASGATWLSGRSNLYPQYFLNSYHHQSDGYLSASSASVYEHSTETLFFGRQDAMQRTVLLPIAGYMVGRDPAAVRLLELSAGTGRLHTFIKDNYPMMPTVCSDLSPFYLAKARENLKYWKQMRQPDQSLGGGPDDVGVQFMQTAAESIAAPDASFDIVCCVYLFHELPEPVRKKAAAEMFRVLKPGGMAVLADSVQLGDRPEWDATISLFSNFQEPYYNSYVQQDLGKLFNDVGFRCDTKWMSSATKTLSFIKPDGADHTTFHSSTSRDQISTVYQ